MPTVITLLSFVAVTIFYLSLLSTSLDQGAHRIFYQTRMGTPGTRRVLWAIAITLSFVFPLILFSNGFAMATMEKLLLWGIVGATSFVVFGPYKKDTFSASAPTLDADEFSKSGFFNAYSLLSNVSLKLPIVVFTFAYFFDSLYGNMSFVILIALITISGVLLMAFGQIAHTRIGLVTAFSVILGLVIMLIMGSEAQLIQIRNQLLGGIGGENQVTAWQLITLGIVSTSIWLGTAGQQKMTRNEEVTQGGNRNILSISALVLAIFYFISILMSRGRYFFSTNADIRIDTASNGFLLIILSGACIMGLMSIFQSTSRIFANRIFKSKSGQTKPEILVLVSRLSIVISVALAILLAPLLTNHASLIIEKLILIYIMMSLPVLVLRIFRRFGFLINPSVVSYSLMGGWTPSVILIALHLSHLIYIQVLINMMSWMMLYCAIFTYIISVIIEKNGKSLKLDPKSGIGIL